ncbi:MAG: cytochrome c oxidase subunit II [Polyangia bacterium]
MTNNLINIFGRIAHWILNLPPQATELAKEVDHLHYIVAGTTMVAAFGVLGFMVAFLVRFRRSKVGNVTRRVEVPLPLEIAFVTIPLVIFLSWFQIGFKQYVRLTTPPKDAMDVYVMGKKWMWKFAYPEGPNGLNVLRVPANRPVRLLITSRDVLHAFFVPAFRVKMDAVPGRYSQTWFTATVPGTYPVYCAEYCGTAHSMMLAEVIVMEPEAYDKWIVEASRGRLKEANAGVEPNRLEDLQSDMVTQGRRIAAEQGCFKCHTVTGETHIGPTWLNMYHSTHKMQTGEEILVDEAYMTESMMDPNARQVAGYKLVMPSYFGRLHATETAAIIEYIKSLRTSMEGSKPEGPAYEPVGTK